MRLCGLPALFYAACKFCKKKHAALVSDMCTGAFLFPNKNSAVVEMDDRSRAKWAEKRGVVPLFVGKWS